MRLLPWLAGGAALSGCARVTVDDASSLVCLSWTGPEHAVPDGQPADLEACVKGPNRWGEDEEALPQFHWTLVDLCIGAADDGSCPGALAAATRLVACVEKREGDACEADQWGGACTTTTLWSLCGPDPTAKGGCCYQAVVVESTYLE